MGCNNYVIVHTDHRMEARGVNSGAENATISLARYLVREGKDVTVAAILEDEEGEAGGVNYVNLGKEYNVSKFFRSLREKGERYHLISSGRALPTAIAYEEPLCLSRVLITHDRSGNDTGIRPKTLEHWVDKVVCVSDAQRQVLFGEGASSAMLQVVHNGVDHDLFQYGESDNRDFHKLIFVGALVYDKGLHLLLQSYAELKAKYPQLTLDVYGSASLWSREKYLDEVELERSLPGVKFHGKVKHTEIARAFAHSGICVIPSVWFDPFPLTSLEAQAAGCPVVTFNVGGLREGILNGETGIVLPEVNQPALTSTLDILLSNPARLRTMSKRAAEHTRKTFVWDRVAKSIISLCEEAAAPRLKKTVTIEEREIEAHMLLASGAVESARSLLTEIVNERVQRLLSSRAL